MAFLWSRRGRSGGASSAGWRRRRKPRWRQASEHQMRRRSEMKVRPQLGQERSEAGAVTLRNGVGLGLAPSLGGALELDAVGVVEQAVEDGVGQGGVGARGVPVVRRELADDHGGAELAAVLDDLEQVAGLLGGGGGEQEVVEDQERDLGQLSQQPGGAAVAAGQGQVGEQGGGAGGERGGAAAEGGLGGGQ